MKPTVGRIVLVKSPAFFGEVPAIVTAVYGEETINVRAFTNNDEVCPLLTALNQQEDSSLGWGWRWPPQAQPPTIKCDISPEELARLGMQPGGIIGGGEPTPDSSGS